MTLAGAIANGGTTLTFDNNTGNITVSVLLAVTGAVAKSNAGTTILYLTIILTRAAQQLMPAHCKLVRWCNGAITGAIVDNGAL